MHLAVALLNLVPVKRHVSTLVADQHLKKMASIVRSQRVAWAEQAPVSDCRLGSTERQPKLRKDFSTILGENIHLAQDLVALALPIGRYLHNLDVSIFVGFR